MFKAIKYLFSSDFDGCNQTFYCVRLCKGSYVQQSLAVKPWVRRTTPDKSDSFWMSRVVAEDFARRAVGVGYPDAKVEKVHWWNVVSR